MTTKKILKLVYLGVDIHPPSNEMANRLVDTLAQCKSSINIESVEIWSIQLQKPIAEKQEHLHLILIGWLGKSGQLLKLLLMCLVRANKNTIIHYVGNGSQSLIVVLAFFAKIRNYRLIVSFLSRTNYAYLPRSAVYVTPYKDTSAKFHHINPASSLLPTENKSSRLKKIAFASVPRTTDEFEAAGLYLLMQAAGSLAEYEFHILNRFDSVKEKLQLISKDIDNIFIHNEIITDIESEFAKFDAFIAPYTESGRAEIPLSLVEALALGKPILASTKIEIAHLIQQYECGVTFTPDSTSLQIAVKRLANHYEIYTSKTRIIHDCEFSSSRMVEQYIKLYSETDS